MWRTFPISLPLLLFCIISLVVNSFIFRISYHLDFDLAYSVLSFKIYVCNASSVIIIPSLIIIVKTLILDQSIINIDQFWAMSKIELWSILNCLLKQLHVFRLCWILVESYILDRHWNISSFKSSVIFCFHLPYMFLLIEL